LGTVESEKPGTVAIAITLAGHVLQEAHPIAASFPELIAKLPFCITCPYTTLQVDNMINKMISFFIKRDLKDE